MNIKRIYAIKAYEKIENSMSGMIMDDVQKNVTVWENTK